MEESQISSLVVALNGLTGTGILSIFLIGVFYILHIRGKRSEKRDDQESKDRRAKVYADSMKQLATSIKVHDINSVAALNESSDQLRRNISTVKSLETSVRGLSKVVTKLDDKSTGKMSVANSLAFFEPVFSQITNEFQAIFRQSLEENDFKRRRSHIERRVKSRLSKVLSENLGMLQEIDQLAIDPRRFFPVHLNSTNEALKGSENYILVEQAWDQVEPCYEKEIAIRARVEEASTLIDELIAAHFSKYRRQVDEANSGTGRHKKQSRRISTTSAERRGTDSES